MKASLSQIAINMIVANIKPKVTVLSNVDGSQKVIFEYDVPLDKIKEFDDWKTRMEHLIDKDTGEHILED